MIQFIQAHAVEILAGLLAISEALDWIPSIKASSLSKAIKNGLKKLLEIVAKPPAV